MFGINNLHQIKEIAEGYTNWALDRESELAEKRMTICKECPIYNPDTDRCDSKKCYNKETGDITNIPSSVTVCGCGCYMNKKVRSVTSKCVLGKW